MSEAQAEMDRDGGRAFLRYSGTEPKIRLLLEGRDEAVLERWNARILQAIRESLC
jgi:phosphoglucosamine mutase